MLWCGTFRSTLQQRSTERSGSWPGRRFLASRREGSRARRRQSRYRRHLGYRGPRCGGNCLVRGSNKASCFSMPAVRVVPALAGSRFSAFRCVTDEIVEVGGLLHELSDRDRSEEHTSELQSLMRISYAVFCLKKKK